MKVTKEGKVKLEAGEIRIGNYFIKREKEHIKIQDLNAVFSLRLSVRMPIGVWLKSILEKGAEGENTIKTYVAVMWSLISVVPDDELIQALLTNTQDALNRHPDWYGFKPNPTEEEQVEAEQEGKEIAEFEQSLKEMPDAPDATPAE